MSEPIELSLRLLGEIEVVRRGERLLLPPSRKVRALLAYLVATGRPHGRSRLCSIFWDVPDDPRGALRSTLSKLRAVVDSPGRPRIIAERDSIRVDISDVEVDLLTVRRALAAGVDAASTQRWKPPRRHFMASLPKAWRCRIVPNSTTGAWPSARRPAGCMR